MFGQYYVKKRKLSIGISKKIVHFFMWLCFGFFYLLIIHFYNDCILFIISSWKIVDNKDKLDEINLSI